MEYRDKVPRWKTGGLVRSAGRATRGKKPRAVVDRSDACTMTDAKSARAVAASLAAAGDDVDAAQHRQQSRVSVQDLSHEDKAKIGKLLQRVVELGRLNQTQKQQWAQEVAALEQQVTRYQAQNQDVIAQTLATKGQLQRAITVLKG
jgi:hypothetical protein